MRNAFALVAALCIGSALTGCNSNSSAPAGPSDGLVMPNPIEEAHGTIAWTVALQAECPATNMEYCIAGYKFSVLSDGHYQAGPGPNNEMKTGSLTSEETSTIAAAVASGLSGLRLQAVAQTEIDDSGSNSTVTLVEGSDSSVITLVQSEGSNLSYLTSSADSAKGLLSSLQALAEKYYTVPFPDTCVSGADAYSALVTSLQTCTQDSDCSYYDSSLQVILSATNQTLRTDDCTLIKPIVVGNTTAMAANLAKLQASSENVKNACGDRIFRNDCSGIQDILITGAATCNQGACQAKSAN